MYLHSNFSLFTHQAEILIKNGVNFISIWKFRHNLITGYILVNRFATINGYYIFIVWFIVVGPFYDNLQLALLAVYDLMTRGGG